MSPEEESPTQPTWGDVTAASAAADEQKRPRTRIRSVMIGDTLRVMSAGEEVAKRLIDCAVDNDRRIQMVQEMGLLLESKREKADKLKEHAKLVKGELADLETRARELGRSAASGVEARLLEVAVLRDDSSGDIVELRCDTGEEVGRRQQTYAEQQDVIPGIEVSRPNTDVDATDMGLDEPPPRRRGRPKKAVS